MLDHVYIKKGDCGVVCCVLVGHFPVIWATSRCLSVDKLLSKSRIICSTESKTINFEANFSKVHFIISTCRNDQTRC